MLRTIATRLTLAATLALPLLAHADAAQDTAAKELIEIAHLGTLSAGLTQQVTNSSVPLLQQYFMKNKVTLTPDQQKRVQAGLKGYIDRQHKIAVDYFGSTQIKQQLQGNLVQAYDAQFTTPELQQIAAFYKTPAGQKLMKLQGQIVDGVAGEMLKAADKNLLPKMQAVAAEYGKSVAK